MWPGQALGPLLRFRNREARISSLGTECSAHIYTVWAIIPMYAQAVRHLGVSLQKEISHKCSVYRPSIRQSSIVLQKHQRTGRAAGSSLWPPCGIRQLVSRRPSSQPYAVESSLHTSLSGGDCI